MSHDTAMYQEERQHLEWVLAEIRKQLVIFSERRRRHADQISTEHQYLSASRAEMDNAEISSVNEAIDSQQKAEVRAKDRQQLLKRQLDSPYFGKIDFAPENTASEISYYIGCGNVTTDNHDIIVYDWRTPVASLFYDFEKGDCQYSAPLGIVKGCITAKRQIKVKHSVLEYVVESSATIDDEILIGILANGATAKMRNIVDSIQSEQNKIIRDESNRIVIIQGVAGSGKTAVALHRVAFLLYRSRKTLKSDNILIISPNKVFSSYISDVLPELGEQNIREFSLIEIAKLILKQKCPENCTYHAHLEHLYTASDDKFLTSAKIKASYVFAIRLAKYMLRFESENFVAHALKGHGWLVTAESLRIINHYEKEFPVAQRIARIVQSVENQVESQAGRAFANTEKNAIRAKVASMFTHTDPFTVYVDFLESLQSNHVIYPNFVNEIDYSDVFSFAYICTFLSEISTGMNIKHLVVDEMQDYTPIQYLFINRIFKCEMTILGDVRQAVNPCHRMTLKTLSTIFPSAHFFNLTKSYRSTYEIIDFTKHIFPKLRVEAVHRHGQSPHTVGFSLWKDQLRYLANEIRLLAGEGSVGIICKSQENAKRVYSTLCESIPELILFTPEQTSFETGVIVTSVYLAKGLEFATVFVPDCDEHNFRTPSDRLLLYTACTRALHRLFLTYTGIHTPFIIGGDGNL